VGRGTGLGPALAGPPGTQSRAWRGRDHPPMANGRPQPGRHHGAPRGLRRHGLAHVAQHAVSLSAARTLSERTTGAVRLGAHGPRGGELPVAPRPQPTAFRCLGGRRLSGDGPHAGTVDFPERTDRPHHLPHGRGGDGGSPRPGNGSDRHHGRLAGTDRPGTYLSPPGTASSGNTGARDKRRNRRVREKPPARAPVNRMSE